MGCIYVISNKINNKQYVGQAKNFEQRKQKHLNNTWNDNKKTRNYHMAIHRAIRKYGEDAFTWEILEDNIPNEKMNELEIKYIAKLDTFNSGYNSNTGGSSSFGYRHDPETRKRMSISAKNKPPVSDVTRERLSKASRGRTHSKETLAKMRVILNSPEVKAKRVNTLRGNKKRWLAVDQYTKTGEFIASYDSLVTACEKTGVHVSSICDVLKGRYLAAGGFIWVYSGDKCPEYTPIVNGRKEVVQYTRNGVLIKKWKGIRIAEKAIGATRGSIGYACSDKSKSPMVCGFLWGFVGGSIPVINELEYHDKRVSKYDKNGNLIFTYSSLTEASKMTGIHIACICGALKGRQKLAGGFIWKYKNEK